MVRRLGCCTLILLWFVARGLAAQDEIELGVYASIEQSIRAEYEGMLARWAHRPDNNSTEKTTEFIDHLKMIFYNKAALYAVCAGEADHDRPPDLPPSMNPALRSCVEGRLDQLQKLIQTWEYVKTFFPERIGPCGERSRLLEQEKLLRPYSFLHLAEPKLYDLSRYSACLMSP